MANMSTFPFYEEMVTEDGEIEPLICSFCGEEPATVFWAAAGEQPYIYVCSDCAKKVLVDLILDNFLLERSSHYRDFTDDYWRWRDELQETIFEKLEEIAEKEPKLNSSM